MHRSWPAAVALALLLTVSALVVASGGARAAPAGPSATPSVVHPAGTDQIRPTDANGTPMSDYSVGYTQGLVYFAAWDPSGDPTATVQIHDLNATRDGLPNPVASWIVKFNAGALNASYLWNGYYRIPFDLALGGTWNITIGAPNGGFASATFQVHTFRIAAYPAFPAYLPGHVASVYFALTQTVNGAPYSSASTLQVLGEYATATGVTHSLFGGSKDLPVVARGTFNFTVPVDASTSSSVALEFWANATQSATPYSETTYSDVPVGTLAAPLVTLSSCPAGCASSSFASGSPVYVTVDAQIRTAFGSAPAVGETVNFRFFAGSVPVTAVPGSPPTSLVTNDTGGAAILFLASTPTFALNGANTVSVTVTDNVNPGLTATSNATFVVLPASAGTATLQVRLDASQYYGGDTVTAAWQLGSANASLAKSWVADGWWVWEVDSGRLLAYGNLTGAASQGQILVKLPTSYGGLLLVAVEAHNATATVTSWATATVRAPAILLEPSESFYLPGDHVTVAVSTEGQVFAGASLWMSVVDNLGNTVQSGPVANHQVALAVPTVGAPSSFHVSVWAQSSGLGAFAASSLTLEQFSGYVLSAGVLTPSHYTDGSYQPGQTISVAYNVKALGLATLPKSYEVTVFPGLCLGYCFGAQMRESLSPSGAIDYTIPSGTPTGLQQFTVVAQLGGCGACTTFTTFSAFVEPSPPLLDYEPAAGSGITVGWLILLGAVAALAVLGFLAYQGRLPRLPTRRPRPTDAPSTPGPLTPFPTWQETPPPPPEQPPSPIPSAPSAAPPLPPAAPAN